MQQGLQESGICWEYEWGKEGAALGPLWGWLAGVCPDLWHKDGPLSSRDSPSRCSQEGAVPEAMGVPDLRGRRGKCSQKSRGKADSNEDVSGFEVHDEIKSVRLIVEKAECRASLPAPW